MLSVAKKKVGTLYSCVSYTPGIENVRLPEGLISADKHFLDFFRIMR